MSFFSRLCVFLIITAAGISLLFYPFVPLWMASHWDPSDNPDRYIPRGVGLFVLPLVMSVLYFIFQWVPNQSSYKKDIEHVLLYYDEFLFVIISFLFYIHFVMIIWNSGVRFSLGQLVAPAFGAVLFYLGHMVQHTKPATDTLWKKSHVFIGQLFQIAGAVSCLGFVSGSAWFYFTVYPFIFALIHAAVYLLSMYPSHERSS